MCKIKEIIFEVVDRSRQAFDNKVIKVTFNPHTTTEKTTFIIIIVNLSLVGNNKET
jgi:hypothetical protein